MERNIRQEGKAEPTLKELRYRQCQIYEIYLKQLQQANTQ